MCGIAGFTGSGARGDLERMVHAIAHRGPDGSGAHIDEEHAVFLGHLRLSIIDIADGAQPMANEDGSTVVVFNGEIYNHAELRKELEAAGQTFKTNHSDTEVLVRGYDQWGEGFVERIEGMFALALYDRRRRRLLLIRDRFGEKPLFYAATKDGLAFASELSALRAHPLVASAALDPAALRKFFAYSFLPGSVTPYRGVHRLQPGMLLRYDIGTAELVTRRYWRFAIENGQRPAGSHQDWADEVGSLLRQAVSSRLQSDVPLGVFLSGGVDSSAVATLASDLIAPARLSTFSIGFDEPSFDETQFAATAAQSIGSLHHLESCRIGDMLTRMPQIVARMRGDPLGDPSILPTFLLCEEASRHVKVALSGDGADELFGGYDPFKALALARAYRNMVPRPMHKALMLLAARLPPSEANMSFDFKLNRALRGVNHEPRLWNPIWLGGLAPDELSRVFDGRVDLEDVYSEAIELWDNSRSESDVDRTLEFYTNLYLPDDILVKTDRASMLNGLEVRTPFLHLGLVDYVRRLPHDVKYRKGVTKWILKETLRRVLPDSIISRKKKGFGVPVAKWLRATSFQTLKKIDGIDDTQFARWCAAHRQRRTDHRAALWCRLILEHSVA